MEERKFVIVTDSGADLSAEYLSKNGVELIGLGFTMNGVNYGEDGESIGVKEFYDLLRGGAMPTTYQATPESVRMHVEPLLQAGKDVLCIAFSSGLSGTCGSYQIAARALMEEYPCRKVLVVDSLCASMGQGLLVDYAVKKADSGASIDEAAAYLEGVKKKIAHFFTVDNLYHLKRGGRVSSVTAFVGSILKIKPIMHVDDNGKLTVIGKAMGRRKALVGIVERLLETAELGENDPIFISHGDCIEDVETVKKLLKERLPNVEIVVGYIGAVIGAHAGAGTVAIFCKGKVR
jgi:DegV family protein with EDD domain